MTPIWLDNIITWTDTAGNAEPVVFVVTVGGTEIYRGRLLCEGGQYSFNLSEIVADLMGQRFPTCLQGGRGAYPVARVSESAPDTRHGVFVGGWYASNEGGTYDFSNTPIYIYDWSYVEPGGPDAVPAVASDFLRSDPIDGYLHPLQYVILSAFDDLTLTARGASLALGMKTNTVLPPGTWAAGDIEVTDGTRSVRFTMPACSRARYVLHYVNAFGGWDSFVPRGLCKQVDGLTRSEYTRHSFNNNGDAWAPRRGRTVYDVAVARRWEMSTAWMTEAQAGRMHHLLESPEVWLFDTVDARFLPVVVTNPDCERKTNAGEGGHLISYQLTIDEATGRARR